MAQALPAVVPLFPLPNVVHFPRALLPLHVFEPRYRALVRDVLGGARLVGMMLLRDEPRAHSAGTPPIFETGTAGEIVRAEALPDGRFNIVLRGVREFRVLREVGATAYRQAEVSWRATCAETRVASELRQRLLDLVAAYVGRPPAVPDPAPDDEQIVNVLAQQLDLPVLERQALLEAEGVTARAERLVEVLAFHVEARRHGALGSSRAH
jgi:hypothetical protein